MTDKEKAIVMAHTGICMLTGDKFQIFHKYIEEIMGRPLMTHEIGLLAEAIKEKSKADFISLCESCEDEEETAEWKISYGSLVCTKCGYSLNDSYYAGNYCQNCGRRMKGVVLDGSN